MFSFKWMQRDFTRYVHVKNTEFEISSSVAKRILESLPGMESIRFMIDEESGIWYRAYVIFKDSTSAENAVNCLNLELLEKRMFSADIVHNKLLYTWEQESKIVANSYDNDFYGAVVIDNMQYFIEVDLCEIFSKYGSIIYIYVIPNLANSASLRILIVYSTLVEAVSAVIAVHDTVILGSLILARLLLTAKDYTILAMSENSDKFMLENEEKYFSCDLNIESSYRVQSEYYGLVYTSECYRRETIRGYNRCEKDGNVEPVFIAGDKEMIVCEDEVCETTTENNLIVNSSLDVEVIEVDSEKKMEDSNEGDLTISDCVIKQENHICEDDMGDEKMETTGSEAIAKQPPPPVQNKERKNTPNSRLKKNSYDSGWNCYRNNSTAEKQGSKTSLISNGSNEYPKRKRQNLENRHLNQEGIRQSPYGWKQVQKNNPSRYRRNKRRDESGDRTFLRRNSAQNNFGRSNYLEKLRAEIDPGNWNSSNNAFYNYGKRKLEYRRQIKANGNEELKKDYCTSSASERNSKFVVTESQSETSNHSRVEKSTANHSCDISIQTEVTSPAEKTEDGQNTTPNRVTYAEALARKGAGNASLVSKSIFIQESKDKGSSPRKLKRGT